MKKQLCVMMAIVLSFAATSVAQEMTGKQIIEKQEKPITRLFGWIMTMSRLFQSFS